MPRCRFSATQSGLESDQAYAEAHAAQTGQQTPKPGTEVLGLVVTTAGKQKAVGAETLPLVPPRRDSGR